MVSTPGHSQRVWRGTTFDGSTVHQRWRGRRQNHPDNSVYTLLHQHLDGNGRKGLSLEQRPVQRRRSTSRWTSGFKADGNLLTWIPRCTSMTQAWEAWMRRTPAMRGEGKGSHRWWADEAHVIWRGRQRRWPMMTKPGAKRLHGHGVSYTNGIRK
jgi:hypothetical protein